MLESLIHIVSGSVEAGAAASHSPQTAIAAVLCAALVNFLS
ncbi:MULTISPECIES: YshB family small membrane protein [Superficieibacter]|nr:MULTISPECIES: YshB family small membrane protein [Superficieibacter]MDU2941072.1 YshB family small membrane protein [Enterobacteriaceae bacterium]WES68371.1 YshB family small membrane protein [Superficieibacter sp. HKU1]